VLLALALGLWLGAFEAERASADPGDLTVTVQRTGTAATGTWAPGTLVTFVVTVNASAATTAADGDITLEIRISGAAQEGTITAPGSTCAAADPQSIDCDVANFSNPGSKTVTFTARLTAVGTALVGAFIDPLDDPDGDGVTGEEDEGAANPDIAEDEGDDEGAVDCSGVGEGTDGGTATEPDNFDCVDVTVANADLTITKTVDPAETTVVGQGAVLYYTLTVTNSASASGWAKDVLIRDTLESGDLSLFSVSPGSGVTCGDITPPEINCTAATIAPGQSRTVDIVATVIPSSGTVLNGASVDPLGVIGETNDDADDRDTGHDCAAVGEGTDFDPDTEEDNFDCTVHTVGGALDLTITKTASPSSGSAVATGDTITYTITVSATGVAATNVPIQDTLDSGLTLVSVSPGSNVTCSDTTPPVINCTASTIAAGSSVSLTVTATVAATSGTVKNGARVDPSNIIAEANDDADDESLDCAAVGEGSDTGEETEPDNFDCTSHTVGQLNLTITKTASPSDGSTVASGSTIAYTITVSASGAAASSVAIRDTIGTGLSLTSVSPVLTSVSPGSGVTCSDTTAPEINCTAATIAAGSSVSLTVNTTVTATSGTVLNGARVDPANAISETNDDADDPSLDCSAVGEGTDAGEATEPDNFDCTSHTVGGAATRTLNLSPAGWHNFVWTGASGTDPATALSCIAGKYDIAYEWVDSLQAWERYVPGCVLPELCTMDPLTKYDPLVVLINAAGVTCQMSVAP
jgi:uncharacterized repeat protein (TIGR01451 family)/fimbrial isopeptide formation D2 family protein